MPHRVFGIASCKAGVFPTIVDTLALEVMSFEVFWGFVVEKTS